MRIEGIGGPGRVEILGGANNARYQNIPRCRPRGPATGVGAVLAPGLGLNRVSVLHAVCQGGRTVYAQASRRLSQRAGPNRSIVPRALETARPQSRPRI